MEVYVVINKTEGGRYCGCYQSFARAEEVAKSLHESLLPFGMDVNYVVEIDWLYLECDYEKDL